MSVEIIESKIKIGDCGYELVDNNHYRYYLYSGHVNLCNDYEKCRVIIVKAKNLMCYYDTVNEKLYVTYYDIELGKYHLDYDTLQQLMDYLQWDNCIIYNHHYDWEESILCIEKKEPDK